jgi:hypothetical protein
MSDESVKKATKKLGLIVNPIAGLVPSTHQKAS